MEEKNFKKKLKILVLLKYTMGLEMSCVLVMLLREELRTILKN